RARLTNTTTIRDPRAPISLHEPTRFLQRKRVSAAIAGDVLRPRPCHNKVGLLARPRSVVPNIGMPEPTPRTTPVSMPVPNAGWMSPSSWSTLSARVSNPVPKMELTVPAVDCEPKRLGNVGEGWKTPPVPSVGPRARIELTGDEKICSAFV